MFQKENADKFSKERRFIFLSIFGLSLFGLIMIYSASCVYAWKLYHDPAYFIKKQFIFLCISILMFFATLSVNVEYLRKYNKAILLFNIILLLLVLLIGKSAGGARRWFQLGPLSFQVSELLKISLLLYISDYLVRKREAIGSFKDGVLPILLVEGLVFASVVLEPDFGTVIFWLIWTFLMFFIGGVRIKHILLIVLFSIVASLILVESNPYRFKRIMTFVNPWKDPKGNGFQVIQSQIAFGEGGITGTGLGEGKQKLLFLPAAHTDFIFSIIAEEFGLIGSISLFSFYFVIFLIMLKISRDIKIGFPRYFCMGLSIMIELEVIINVGVSCGFFPTKGMVLPFVSYGGTNLLAHYIALGLFFNVSRTYENYPCLR